MSNPSTNLWSELIGLNKTVDGLFERARRVVMQTEPRGRELAAIVPFETRFLNLPATYATTVVPGSDAVDNIKQTQYTNLGSRLRLRSISFQSYYEFSEDPSGDTPAYNARISNEVTAFPFNWRWNFQTSITQRWYCPQRVLKSAGGRQRSGSHLVFREPLIVEPMETLTLEIELLGGFGMVASQNSDLGSSTTALIVTTFDGYREGV